MRGWDPSERRRCSAAACAPGAPACVAGLHNLPTASSPPLCVSPLVQTTSSMLAAASTGASLRPGTGAARWAGRGSVRRRVRRAGQRAAPPILLLHGPTSNLHPLACVHPSLHTTPQIEKKPYYHVRPAGQRERAGCTLGRCTVWLHAWEVHGVLPACPPCLESCLWAARRTPPVRCAVQMASFPRLLLPLRSRVEGAATRRRPPPPHPTTPHPTPLPSHLSTPHPTPPHHPLPPRVNRCSGWLALWASMETSSDGCARL